MLLAKQYGTIQGHSCGVITNFPLRSKALGTSLSSFHAAYCKAVCDHYKVVLAASSPTFIRAHRRLRHHCRLYQLLLGKQCEAMTRSFLRRHRRLSFALTGACDIIVIFIMLLLGEQCGTITRSLLWRHCRSFALTSACDFIVVVHCCTHAGFSLTRLLLQRGFLRIMLDKHRLYIITTWHS
jgi:hypothetical protein